MFGRTKPNFNRKQKDKAGGNKSIYLHRSGPLLENGLDRRENRYGRYGSAGFSQHFHIYRRGG